MYTLFTSFKGRYNIIHVYVLLFSPRDSGIVILSILCLPWDMLDLYKVFLVQGAHYWKFPDWVCMAGSDHSTHIYHLRRKQIYVTIPILFSLIVTIYVYLAFKSTYKTTPRHDFFFCDLASLHFLAGSSMESICQRQN